MSRLVFIFARHCEERFVRRSSLQIDAEIASLAMTELSYAVACFSNSIGMQHSTKSLAAFTSSSRLTGA
jgi:hypothetical protein